MLPSHKTQAKPKTDLWWVHYCHHMLAKTLNSHNHFFRIYKLQSISLKKSTYLFSPFCHRVDMKEQGEEEGFLAGLKIPAPWASGKTVESIHPVRDNYKFKETVHIPGARCLYLRFDSRCASQYDYDKVGIYWSLITLQMDFWLCSVQCYI